MEHDNHGFEAKMVEDSIGEHGIRLSTLQLRYPRFIHAEAKTHRVIKQGSEECESIALTQNHALMDDPALSRNASSSRAIPVAKMLEQVRNAPAMPIHWGKNQPGMQAHEELGWAERDYVKAKWFEAAGKAADIAEEMMNEGAHKQVVNRILEPFQFISVIVTASEWANFFILRDHPDAQPEIRFLAQLMKQAMDASTPVLRSPDHTHADGWHLPYITNAEREDYADDPELLARMSAARCARVSYLTHDGAKPSMEKDLELYERLVGSTPLHASPVEHQATPTRMGSTWIKNFRGWRQFRVQVETDAVLKGA